MSAQLGRDNSGINYVLRSGNARRSWKERVGIEPRSVYSFSIPPRDEAGAQALEDMASRGINLVANAAAQSADHVSSYFTMLRAELGFYVSCLNLRRSAHRPWSAGDVPRAGAWSPAAFSCEDLRDASLALRTDNVVGNDVDADGKPLVIITGANSGGKSTFLRSTGLAQLMMQCGMFVTARSLRASVCRQIFTHFIREEDPDMVSGRLDEELEADEHHRRPDQPAQPRSCSTSRSPRPTSARDPRSAARWCAPCWKPTSGSSSSPTSSTSPTASTASTRTRPCSCRAPRQPDGQRTYKLTVAEPLPTSYGQDIYHRIGGWLGGQHGDATAQAGLADLP